MSKKTNEEIIQTNPYWPGGHIIDGRDKKKNVSSENGFHFKHLYKPLSVQSLDEAFGDDSEESENEEATDRSSKYHNFPDISTDNNTLSVLNLSDNINCMTLSLVGDELPIYYYERIAHLNKRKYSASKSSNNKNKKCFLSSSTAYHCERLQDSCDVKDLKANTIKNSSSESLCDQTCPVVCFVVVMDPWTIVEIGKIAKKSSFQIHSDIQKFIPILPLLNFEKNDYAWYCHSELAKQTQEFVDFDVFPLDINANEKPMSSCNNSTDDDTSMICSQSFGGALTHFLHPSTYFAYDFDIAEGTPIRAMVDGKVVEAHDGSSCFGPDSRNLFKSNQISIEITGSKGTSNNSFQPKFIIEYVHIQGNSIPDCFKKIGTFVKKGDIIARSGRAGFTPTPHLHLQVVQKFEIKDADKNNELNVKEKVQELISLAESLDIDQISVVTEGKEALKNLKDDDITLKLHKKLNELRKIIRESYLDEKINQFGKWVENNVFRTDLKEINFDVLKLIPEYLSISEWSVPFTIQGQHFKQGQQYGIPPPLDN